MTTRSRALRDGAIIAGLAFLAYYAFVVAPRMGTFGIDAFAYWDVDLPGVYRLAHGEVGSFVYAPPAALVADVFNTWDWHTFLFLWTMLLIGSIIWLAGSPAWIVAALAFPPVALELYHGNIHVLLAVAIVLGFRHPWTWSFVLLTKPTAGVGLLWFAVRGEWRSLVVALGTTAGLAAASWLIAPGLWTDYLALMTQPSGFLTASAPLAPVPLWIRMAAAAAIVTWGARTDRRWTVPVAVFLALPALWFAGAAVLLALIPEYRNRVRRPADSPATPPDTLPSPWPATQATR